MHYFMSNSVDIRVYICYNEITVDETANNKRRE